MKHLIKLYDTWEKAKDTFVKPSLRVYFGKWRNDPNLPVWRRGPQIPLVKWGKLSSKAYMVKDSVMICSGEVPYTTSSGETRMSKCYEWVPKHKLPGKLRCGQYVWYRSIRKKLKKWHLSWVPPIVQLPYWMSFHIFNWELCWKTKWDDFRFEFPPQFTIVAFGLSLTFTVHCPVNNEYSCDDHYWEAMLDFIYSKSHTLKEAIETSGIWRKWDKDGKEVDYFAVRPEYIVSNKLEEYYAATSEIKARKEKVIL